MRILVLHNGIRRQEWLRRSLQYEHIEATFYDPTKPEHGNDIHENVLSAAAVMLYIGMNTSDRVIKIAQAIKREHKHLPMIVLNEETSRVNVKLKEADADFSPPFDFGSIARAIKQNIYRGNGNGEANGDGISLRFSDLCLDPNARLVRRGKRMIRLRNKEFALLEFFMLNRGRILTRDMILEHVWDRNTNCVSNTVDVHVNMLRRKITLRKESQLIHTVYCVGYKLDRKP